MKKNWQQNIYLLPYFYIENQKSDIIEGVLIDQLQKIINFV